MLANFGDHAIMIMLPSMQLLYREAAEILVDDVAALSAKPQSVCCRTTFDFALGTIVTWTALGCSTDMCSVPSSKASFPA